MSDGMRSHPALVRKRLRKQFLNQGLNFAVYPDYSLSCLDEFRLIVRVCSQSQKYKALLIHFVVEFPDLLYPVQVRHKSPSKLALLYLKTRR